MVTYGDALVMRRRVLISYLKVCGILLNEGISQYSVF